MYREQVDEIVTIKLKRGTIPTLLGAIRLGMWAEDWCAALVQTGINSYDTHSQRWVARASYLFDEVKQQTQVPSVDQEYGTIDALATIQDMVDKQCELNIKECRILDSIDNQEAKAQFEFQEALQSAMEKFHDQMEEVYEERLKHDADSK